MQSVARHNSRLVFGLVYLSWLSGVEISADSRESDTMTQATAGAVALKTPARDRAALRQGVLMDKRKFAVLSLLVTAAAVGQEAVDTPRERTGKIDLTNGQAEGRLLAFDPATGDHREVFAGCDIRPRISPDGQAV